MHPRLLQCLVVSLGALAAPALHAQEAPREGAPRALSAGASGFIVRIDAGRLVVALDSSARVSAGTRLGLFRPVTARHPVTRRTLYDRLPLGTVVLDHVGHDLSTARPLGELSDTPRAGDVLMPLTVEDAGAASADRAPGDAAATAAATAPPATLAAAPTAAPTDDRPLTEALVTALGRPPEERVGIYQRFLVQHRDSAYAPHLRAELSALARIATALRQTRETPPPPPQEASRPPRLALADETPTSLRVGEPAVVAVQLDPDGTLGEGALFVRRRGAPTYERVAMRAEGDGYLRAGVPRAYVTPGVFEYFIEVAAPDGRAVNVSGRSDAPRVVEVLPPPEGPPAARDRSRIDLRGEFADVGTRTLNGTRRAQRFVSVEGDFFQRLGLGWLYGCRVGFGVYDGEAMPLDRLNTADATVHTRVIYGYHELEFAFSDFVHLIGRVQAGVFGTGFVMGAQARLRVGHERRTNVLLGGEVLGEVGQRAFFAFNFAPVERLPVMAQAEVFNQSVAAGDPMFRFIAQVGWRFAPWITVSARGSYQLRNIENGGFGGGLSTTFDW